MAWRMPQHGTEGIGSRTQVGNFAQELQRVPLLLEGIGFGSAVPYTSIFAACTSTRCPDPSDSTSRPSTRMQAPVVIGLSCSSSNFERSTTTCMFATHDPSFRR